MNGTITINKWREYQHYKNRNPPWVKVHRSLLAKDWYRGLSDGAARFLVELWLLASNHDGVVPYDSLMIARDTHRPSTDMFKIGNYLEELASVDAITLAGTDASAGFADALATRGSEIQRFRDSEVQSSETTSPAPAPNIDLQTETFYQRIAPKLRQAVVEEKAIGDVFKNFWPAALKITSEQDLLDVIAWHGKRVNAQWNPARVWNLGNEKGVETFKWALSQMWRSGEVSHTAKPFIQQAS